jgi:flagellar protein FlaG
MTTISIHGRPDKFLPSERLASSVSSADSAGASLRGAPQGTPSARSKPDDLKALMDALRRSAATVAPELQFLVDQGSGKDIIKVLNRTTKEVVWQFPSEEALQVTREIDRYQLGLLVHRQA